MAVTQYVDMVAATYIYDISNIACVSPPCNNIVCVILWACSLVTWVCVSDIVSQH